MALYNVRLDDDDSRKAAELRRAGIPLSLVVREAIRIEYERRIAVPQAGKSRSELVVEVLAAFPDPAGLPPPAVDTRDRRAVKKHIAGKLKRGRP